MNGMDDSGIRRVYDAKQDDPETGIKAGDQVIEFLDGTVRPRMTWRQILDDLVRLPENDRVQAIRDAAELEASVINFLSRENSPWRRRGRQIPDQDQQAAEGENPGSSEEEEPRSLKRSHEREPSRSPEQEEQDGRENREQEGRHTVKYFPVPRLPRVTRSRERGLDPDRGTSRGL
jgi:hypothetical protein